MAKRLLSVAALLLLLSSRAQAAPINLLLTVNILEPQVGNPREVSFAYSFFESATYGWPGGFVAGWPAPVPSSVSALASGGGPAVNLLPGVMQYNISLNVDSLDHVYFIGSGLYYNAPGQTNPPMSVYVAEPPTGDVSDQNAWVSGPPWISLANLGDGISSHFRYINGYPRGVGTFQLTAAAATVPEPSSLFLIGGGLVALAAKKYRQAKPNESIDAPITKLEH